MPLLPSLGLYADKPPARHALGIRTPISSPKGLNAVLSPAARAAVVEVLERHQVPLASLRASHSKVKRLTACRGELCHVMRHDHGMPWIQIAIVAFGSENHNSAFTAAKAWAERSAA
jgi:hypothetical protein